MSVFSTKPKRRLSLQIIRVARELEALHVLGEASTSTLFLAIGDLPPKPVCLKTLHRDLVALELAGFVTKRICVSTQFINGAPMRVRMNVWRLAEPAALRDRLKLIKGLTPKQLALLKEGKQIAKD